MNRLKTISLRAKVTLLSAAIIMLVTGALTWFSIYGANRLLVSDAISQITSIDGADVTYTASLYSITLPPGGAGLLGGAAKTQRFLTPRGEPRQKTLKTALRSPLQTKRRPPYKFCRAPSSGSTQQACF